MNGPFLWILKSMFQKSTVLKFNGDVSSFTSAKIGLIPLCNATLAFLDGGIPPELSGLGLLVDGGMAFSSLFEFSNLAAADFLFSLTLASELAAVEDRRWCCWTCCARLLLGSLTLRGEDDPAEWRWGCWDRLALRPDPEDLLLSRLSVDRELREDGCC